MNAIDIYYQHFQGGKKESYAIDFLINELENSQEGVVFVNYPEFYCKFGVDNWNFGLNDVFKKFAQFIKEANEKSPSATAQRWSNYCLEIERITSQATSLKDIYANPKNYYGTIRI